uniref:SPX domain-containing protein n=1 Tax=Vannella robusta TaxID=1487602 RepID=A0A7S4I8N1_9EUKA|mmetsp:Transcript_21951/g.28034  ORF Transcript_21951/g.28034 Transcript_21951/m.28034 type:complete len:693 (+) Transcript_21951:23-2101(+)
MKFGKFLEEKSKPEWRLYYVDYKYLKKVIKEMKISIQTQKQSKKDAELLFTKSIELEINKVNDFFLMIEKEVQGKLTALRQLLNKAKNFDSTQTKKQALVKEIQHLATQLTDLYEYTLVNFTAFRKILKKHDRHTDMVASPWFLARCKQQPFYSSSKQFGNMLVKLSNCCSVARSILGEEASVVVDQGMSSIPVSTRYWIKPEDVMRVKTMIVQHLPVHMLTSTSSRFPREATDSVAISSCYYDNPDTLESYESRVRRTEGAVAIRFRTYENGDEVYAERKTHHENFSGSFKERFDLGPGDVFDFIRGTYKLEDFVNYLEQEEQSEEYISTACKLFAEVQSEIAQRGFAPTLRTTYRRSAFQDPKSSIVKIAIDTNVQMIKENLKLENDGKWCKSDLDISEDDVHEFPYAVMEVKLQPGQPAPDWVNELVNGPLVRMALKYSKFTHGCAILLRDKVIAKPSWISEFEPNEEEQKRKKAKKLEKELSELSESDELQFNDDIWVEQENAAPAFNEHEGLLPDSKKLQSSSLEDVRRVLDARDKSRPSLFTKVQNLFDFDQRFVKDGKPIMTRMKIEPKTYFANERTFLQWMSFCVIIQGIGIALISFPSTNFVGLISGVCFVAISVGFMAYSLFLFRWRSARIRNNQPGRYDDFWGPFTLFCVMTAAVLVNAILFISNQLFLLSEQTVNEFYNN